MTEREAEKLDLISAQLQRLTGSIQGNGGKGLAGQVEENSEKIDTLSAKMEHVQTVEGCAESMTRCREIRKEEIKSAMREELSAKGRNRWLVVKDIILALLSSSVIAALIAAMATGRTP